MLLRFFCPTDVSPLGQVALGFVDALLELGMPVRLIANRSAQMQAASPWRRHQSLLLTPLESSYVNVVCGQPSDWLRLHTVNVRNVLIAGELAPGPDQVAGALAIRATRSDGTREEHTSNGPWSAVTVSRWYDQVVVPTDEISASWRAIGRDPVVIPLGHAARDTSMQDALRAALLTAPGESR